MRTAAVLFFFMGLTFGSAGSTTAQAQPAEANPGASDTYFTIHNILPAHEVTLGAGTRIGILDRSFEMDSHPELYAGARDFPPDLSPTRDDKETHHGFWMALTLREVAPKAEIFALGIHAGDEAARVEAISKALDWAVENGLDVVTYCDGVFSKAARERLDPVVERTVEAGVVVVFVGYPHPLNLLPGGFGPHPDSDLRDADLNIFSQDCTALIGDQVVSLVDPDDDGIRKNRPFLGPTSRGSVTAGFVALVRSMDPESSPTEIKRILKETSRPMSYRDQLAARVPDVYQAVMNVAGVAQDR